MYSAFMATYLPSPEMGGFIKYLERQCCSWCLALWPLCMLLYMNWLLRSKGPHEIITLACACCACSVPGLCKVPAACRYWTAQTSPARFFLCHLKWTADFMCEAYP